VGDCAEGIAQYKSEYVDPFVSIVASYKGKVPIVLVVEPDSLPNLATNSAHPHCGNEATQNAYKQGIAYAVNELATKTDAALYLDAAHGGWLGWADNLDKYLALLKDMDLPFDKMRGFATNVANYQPLGSMCPWAPDQGYRNAYCLNGAHQDDECCADACKLESQWNPANNELNYAQDLVLAAAGELGFDAHAIIDTGRNGVADMRQDCSNWCNIRGAGAGLKSTVETANSSIIDAYFWLKTPGESDGCSQTLPSGEACPRYDSMCGSADSLGTDASEPPAPEAGAWFDYQVKQLAANAHLTLTSRSVLV
jgi:cellulose 1,4-beta-cellobiosidase